MKYSLTNWLTHYVCGSIFALVAVAAVPAEAPALPAYQVDLKHSSVSGLSSGAFMATQFHVAFSSILVGAGVIAGGPFYCAGSFPAASFLENAMTVCMNPVAGIAPDAGALLQKAKTFAQRGEIDNLENLRKSKIYLFSGRADTTVTTKVVDQAAAFYRLAGVPGENIRYVHDVNAGHSIITSNTLNTECPLTAAPYINDCHFMQSQDILRHIYGELHPPSTQLTGKLLRFNQKKYMRSFFHAYLSSMSDDGYVYVPKSCETDTCKVHIAFHGCEQGARKIGYLFYGTTGYNEIADSNHLIVLYPQAESTTGFLPPYNPKGCWDFWGYSSTSLFNPDFYSKNATQMSAVRAMLEQLAKPRK
jgi:hypothetical protein